MKNKPMVMVLCLFAGLSLVNCTNPSVDAGRVGMLTNEPFFFGEKGEVIGVIIGPSSPGLGWCNEIKYEESAKTWTYKEHFSPKEGSGEDKERDSRILSSDKINMEVSVSVILYIRDSPAVSKGEGDIDQFKLNAQQYFERYVGFWPDRYQEPFRTYIRNLLSVETYTSAKDKRIALSDEAKVWLEDRFEGTPIGVEAVNISNINPPKRMLEEQEMLKATEIAEKRQEKEKLLQEAKRSVMEQEADNLRVALKKAPSYLRWRELQIQQKYVEAFNIAITGEEAKSIEKFWFIPYGTPIAAGGSSKTLQNPNQE